MAQDNVPTVLACDVGNSSIRIASVAAEGDNISEVATLWVGQLVSMGQRLRDLWSAIDGPKVLAAGSVNPAALKALEASALKAIEQKVLVVGRDLPLPIDTDLPAEEQIGIDRLCCAAAAFDKLGTACVVADFGTAIKIDCVSDRGVFLGGAILPGLAMGATGLHENTAQLPAIKLRQPEGVFGKDTIGAMLIGLVRGARGALREMVETYATELGQWPVVLATGGDAELVCGKLCRGDIVQAVVPDLALRGVAMAVYRSMLKGT